MKPIAALLTCCLIAFAQGRRPTVPETVQATPAPWVVDAIALDASGQPVTNLTADDIELTQGGRVRKITHFTWFDTRLHTAATPAAQLPALALSPDEIGRNLVAVVDDLGLSPAGIDAVRRTLRAFVNTSMATGDRLAILRSSAGTGLLQQLTADRKLIGTAIDSLQYLGGSTSVASAGRASWLALTYALDGLRERAGRKVVVFFSEAPRLPGPWGGARSEAARNAHLAGASVYALNPLSADTGTPAGTPSALESLASETGGRFGSDFAHVLQQEQGYYAIGFLPENDAVDPTGRYSVTAPPQLKVRRPGIELRFRSGFLRPKPMEDDPPSLIPVPVLLEDALRSPFGGSAIRTRLTVTFSDYSDRPAVESILFLDAHDIAFIHDLQDMYRGAVKLSLNAHASNGSSTAALVREFQIALLPADYRTALENGLRFVFDVKLPGAGSFQIRAMVADGRSDRLGTAMQFVEIPDLKQGGFAISGLTLRGGTVEAASVDPLEDAAVRSFKQGHNGVFAYRVFNPLTGANKQSALEVQTRIYAEGRLVLDGKPVPVVFGETPAGSRRQITGKLLLDRDMSPGDYILQVNVRDTLAPPGQPRTFSQFIDFHVRD